MSALVNHKALLSLGTALWAKVADDFDSLIKDRDDIDLNWDIEDQYDELSSGLKVLKTLLTEGGTDYPDNIIEPASERLQEEINDILQEQENYCDWDILTPTKTASTGIEIGVEPSIRPVFQDVDKG